MRKDRAMDIHDRGTVDIMKSHVLDTKAHQTINVGAGAGMSMAVIDQPDQLADANIELLYAHSDKFPSGCTLLSCGINTGQESSTYSVNFQIRTAPNDGSPTAVETVATSSSIVAEDDGSLSATAIGVGEYVYAVLPATDVDRVVLWITFTEP